MLRRARPQVTLKAYRDGLAVRLLPVQYPLSQGEPVQAGKPIAATGFAIPAESFGGAAGAGTAVRAGVEARRVLGQGRRRHLTRFLAVQHRAAAVEEGRVVLQTGGAAGRRDARGRHRGG